VQEAKAHNGLWSQFKKNKKKVANILEREIGPQDEIYMLLTLMNRSVSIWGFVLPYNFISWEKSFKLYLKVKTPLFFN
jgi:hypothetical protein